MNTLSTTPRTMTPKSGARLLDSINAIWASVGDGLNEDELTRLLQRKALPVEAGFVFLSLSHEFLTLSVPPQDFAKWYPEQGWITAEKEKIARAIAEKYGLSVYEPVDVFTNYWQSQADLSAAHHHLEFSDRWQTVIIAHPHYLKVRLSGESSAHRYVGEPHCPLTFESNLLTDLSALYRP